MLCMLVLDTDVFLDPSLFRGACLQMSALRQEKIARFRFERDRRLSLGAGVALDLALGAVGLRESTATMSQNAQGKPFLREIQGLHFNLAHSGHYAACALSEEQEVGVDVEAIQPAEDALIQRVCTGRERAHLGALPSPEREGQFCRLWTVKESYMKLLGTGLSLAPERLEINFAAPTSIRQDGAPCRASFAHWRLEDCWLTLCTPVPVQTRLNIPTEEELMARYG